MAFPPWWANRGQLGNLVVVLFFAAGRPDQALQACGDFVIDNQSRIACVCREIRL